MKIVMNLDIKPFNVQGQVYDTQDNKYDLERLTFNQLDELLIEHRKHVFATAHVKDQRL